jgi:hypothetical protein
MTRRFLKVSVGLHVRVNEVNMALSYFVGVRPGRTHRPTEDAVTVADANGPASGGMPFEVTVTNVGGTSAENVVIEVTVSDVARDLNLDLVAKGDTESAGIRGPRRHRRPTPTRKS